MCVFCNSEMSDANGTARLNIPAWAGGFLVFVETRGLSYSTDSSGTGQGSSIPILNLFGSAKDSLDAC